MTVHISRGAKAHTYRSYLEVDVDTHREQATWIGDVYRIVSDVCATIGLLTAQRVIERILLRPLLGPAVIPPLPVVMQPGRRQETAGELEGSAHRYTSTIPLW
jgi:hypothetical protein